MLACRVSLAPAAIFIVAIFIASTTLGSIEHHPVDTGTDLSPAVSQTTECSNCSGSSALPSYAAPTIAHLFTADSAGPVTWNTRASDAVLTKATHLASFTYRGVDFYLEVHSTSPCTPTAYICSAEDVGYGQFGRCRARDPSGPHVRQRRLHRRDPLGESGQVLLMARYGTWAHESGDHRQSG